MALENEINQKLIEDVQSLVTSMGFYGVLKARTTCRPEGITSWWEIAVPDHSRGVNHKDAQRVRMPVNNPEVLALLAEVRVSGTVLGVYEQRGDTLELLRYEVDY